MGKTLDQALLIYDRQCTHKTVLEHPLRDLFSKNNILNV